MKHFDLILDTIRQCKQWVSWNCIKQKLIYRRRVIVMSTAFYHAFRKEYNWPEDEALAAMAGCTIYTCELDTAMAVSKELLHHGYEVFVFLE